MYLLRTVCLLCLVAVVVGKKVKNALYGYDVQMYGDPKAPRIVLLNDKGDVVVDLSGKESTWCVNVFVATKEGKTFYTLVGYGSRAHSELNEQIVEFDYSTNHTIFTISNDETRMPGTPALNQWVLFCITWSGITGDVHFYFDGIEAGKVINFAKNEEVGKDGTLSVGQDQDSYDGEYDGKSGMHGKLTQFNSWNRVLTPKEIIKVVEGKMFGNQVDWRYSQWALGGNALLLPTDAPNAAMQQPSCKDDNENTVATDLTICVRFNGKSSNEETFSLFYYINSYGSKELELIVNKNKSASVVLGIENRIVPHLGVAQGWQHWCFVSSKDTLQVYIDGGLYDTLSDFQEGTKMSSNGDLYVHDTNSRKRVQVKAMDYMVVERALSGEEVAYEYRSQKEELVPANAYFTAASGVRGPTTYSRRIWQQPTGIRQCVGR